MKLHHLVPCTSSQLPQKPSESRPCIYYKLMLPIVGMLDDMIVPNKLKYDELKYDDVGTFGWKKMAQIHFFLPLPAKYNCKHWR